MHLFDDGYKKLRERIFENQKRLGVISSDAKLTPWPDDVLKPWDKLSDVEKKLFIRQVEVFAAYGAYNDYEIGRVIQAFQNMGEIQRTSADVLPYFALTRIGRSVLESTEQFHR